MSEIKNIKLNGTKLPLGGSGGGGGKVFEDVEQLPSTPDSNVIYRILSPVPNTGTIDKVYFNTNLSTAQVKEQLSKLTYSADTDNMSFLLSQITDDKVFYIVASTDGNEYGLACVNFDANGQKNTILFVSSIEFAASFGETINYTGWNPSFNGVVEIDSSMELTSDMGGVIPGNANNKITSLFNTGIKYVNTNNNIEFEFAKKEKNSDDPTFFNIDVYGTINDIEDKVKEVKFTYEEANKIYQSKSIILRLFVDWGDLGVHIWSYALDQCAVIKAGTDSKGNPYYGYIFKFIRHSYTGNVDDPRIQYHFINLQGNYESEDTGLTVDNLLDDHYLSNLVSGGSSGSSVTVDSIVSDSSTNPVQNKVIKGYVDSQINSVKNLIPDVTTVDSAMSDLSTNPVQNKVIKEYVDNAITGIGSSSSNGAFSIAAELPLSAEKNEVNISSVLQTLCNKLDKSKKYYLGFKLTTELNFGLTYSATTNNGVVITSNQSASLGWEANILSANSSCLVYAPEGIVTPASFIVVNHIMTWGGTLGCTASASIRKLDGTIAELTSRILKHSVVITAHEIEEVANTSE